MVLAALVLKISGPPFAGVCCRQTPYDKLSQTSLNLLGCFSRHMVVSGFAPNLI